MNIAVLGAGSWGITLAVLLAENGHSIFMWEKFAENVDEIRKRRESRRYLPDVRIPESIGIDSEMSVSLSNADVVLFVVPSHVVRETARKVSETFEFSRDTLVVNAAKGLEEGSLKRMSEVLQDELPVEPSQILTISGPSHAEEVIRKMPTSVVAAGIDGIKAKNVQEIFFRPYFRVYTNSDIIGVETAVALKNVIAIAAGVCDGLGYGDNTKAALLTRGLVEITRLGVAMGARRETFFGLSGIGDLIVTSLSRHSRNRFVGEKVGQGKKLEEVLGDMVMVAEGVRTTRAAVDLAKKFDVDMPITNGVHDVLFSGRKPRDAINQLMNRPPQDEMKWTDSSRRKGGGRQ
ncbi:MAG: NAD(P)H-dependent glycerol-3-phosphate dehydrogenase [Candidatus Latescibacterota bacterium]|nr:MAG: NAD(P)H-dependent glycerol-3-phosphate dehydrogenase [Candidatus Latescibacterota bacterium]